MVMLNLGKSGGFPVRQSLAQPAGASLNPGPTPYVRSDMAGHSQFKNIMFRKGAKDAKRAKAFTKLAREITVSAKAGGPDPAYNPRLRLAIQNAKAISVPKDNIERAIKKASGNDAENYDEVRYEGFGPGGIGIIVEALTDNRNRTASDVRAAFSKYGGALGADGSVAFLFQRLARIAYPASAASADAMLEAASTPRRRLSVGRGWTRDHLRGGVPRRGARCAHREFGEPKARPSPGGR